MPNFFSSGVPEYPDIDGGGMTRSFFGAFNARSIADLIFDQVVYVASGRADFKRASFSGSPSTKISGTSRVDTRWRSALPTSLPWENSRDKSMTYASGGSVTIF